ncbi:MULTISPECIES: ethylbenzene dehydrogenase-related protein [Rhodomicrobium]|uniref:ethylbenzene dehydrogenase-related protein n=1 Tax=Rhodomicrobium TaxID=1068 RepID=UPI000B4A5710|nr:MULTISPECIES: ethylbenzene dehydrogenase-related protein [Rhodomicrobium]
MARRAIKKTDFGTVLLHWTLVALLVVAVATGLRIAIDGPRDRWLSVLDPVLPQSIVWTAHIPVGTALIALAISYAIYISRAGLSRRVRPDLARLKGIAGRASARYGGLNIVLYWTLFAALATEFVTGTMLYVGYGGWAAELHHQATWVIVLYVPAHIAVHYAIGGRWQLLRVFNPGPLAPRPPEFDPFEVIAAQVQAEPDNAHAGHRPERRMPGPQNPPRPAREPGRGGTVLHAHPLLTAIAGGVGFLVFMLSLDTATRDTLILDQIAESDKPRIDGDMSDPIWRVASSIAVPTQQGANLDGAGQSEVEIRAVHDGTNAYFCFVWEDPTRSLKHLPIQKTETGWRVLQQGFDRGDATAFFEDKFAVLLVGAYTLIPGDRTFHAGRQPLGDKPATLSGRGLHYTTNGGYADMWQWHASTGGMMGWVDDTHFGPPAEPAAAQKAGQSAYKGGFAADPGSGLTELNFEERGPGGYDRPVIPKRLPSDPRKALQATDQMDLDPNIGDRETTRWWLAADDSVPYSREHDARIPIGTVIPGLLLTSGAFAGDRAHIRGMAKWAAGRWTLEVVRRLDTGSKYDTPIATGAYMRVAVFDHTQSRHTRFIRPIRIEVKACEKAAGCILTTKVLRLGEAKSY